MVKASIMRVSSIIVIILLSFSVGKAQSAKRDTLYYLLDTLAVPAKDRLFSYESEKDANIKWITINCPCLEHNIKPQFRMNISKQKIVDRNWLQTHETIDLSSLLNYLKIHASQRLTNSFDLFFVEPNGRKSFKINKVLFLGGYIIVTDAGGVKVN